MDTPFLAITGLKKSFEIKSVLRGIDLALERGERMALMGANGAGKTTLLRILACLTAPSSGGARYSVTGVPENVSGLRINDSECSKR